MRYYEDLQDQRRMEEEGYCPKEPMDTRLNIKMTKSEKAALQEACGFLSCSISNFVRDSIDTALCHVANIKAIYNADYNKKGGLNHE